jgi:pSer/pThr/pTyr-binding forkhead associated (FHA) protein
LTRSPASEPEGIFWVDGDMLFQVEGFGARPDRLVKVRRPFALIGRSAPCDVVLDDPVVNAQHMYLHQDERGVFAVDLATRSGSRINGEDRMVGWLRPGDSIEVAGFRVELVRARVANVPLRHRTEEAPSSAEMLADSPRHDLPRVTLDPRIPGERPWVLGSELVFLGGSTACGIRIRDPAVARAHCAIVRSASGAFLVDLADGPTWVEDQPLRPSGALPLHDGDFLTLGNTRFSVRIEPAARTTDTLPARYNGIVEVVDRGELASIDPEALSPETQNALLAWMMGTMQGSQGEALRRQGEFQIAVTEALRSIQQDNAALLNAHLSRIEKIDRELAALRAEIVRREGTAPSRMAPVPPDVTPLNIPRNIPPRAPEADPSGVHASTAWLLQRVGQLEAESRSTWKDLLTRPKPETFD